MSTTCDPASQHRGLLLDLDGTLADSLTGMYSAYARFLGTFGIQPCSEEFNRLNGPPLDQIVAIMKKSHSLPGTAQELKTYYLKLVREAHRTAPPTEGAVNTVLKAIQCGWTVAVVTSSNRAVALEWLEYNGLLRFVSKVVGGDDVAVGKPDPAPYLQALMSVNCSADNSLAVEDSYIGARSALSAGLSTYVVADPENRSNWPKGVMFLKNLGELEGRLHRA